MSPDDLTPRKIVEKLDQYIIGQTRGQTRRGDCAQEPLAAPECLEGAGGGDLPEEHHHDRAHRRGQDGDRPQAREAGQLAVHQGRGVEVHRGGLCGAGRRVDGPRSGGTRDRHGQIGGAEPRPDKGRGAGGRPAPGYPPPAEAGGEEGDGDDPRRKRDDDRSGVRPGAGYDPREAPAPPPRGEAGRAFRRDRDDRGPERADGRDLLLRRDGGYGAQRQGHAGKHLPAEEEKAAGEGSRGAGDPGRGGGAAARGHGKGEQDGHRAGRAVGDRVPRRDRQDRRGRRDARPGRLAGGGAEGPAADRRGIQREHPLRDGAGPTTSSSSQRGPSR